MSLFTAGDRLKVVVIGNDGIMRSAFVDRSASMAGNKYIITQKDVFFQRLKKWDLFWIDQPTIMFRENSIHAIPRDDESSYPTPQETADIIENGAMHLFTLFGKQSNVLMILLLVIAAVAAGGGCTAAYFAYENNKMVKDIHADVATVQGTLINITSSNSDPYAGGGIPRGGTVIQTIAPRPAVSTGLPKV